MTKLHISGGYPLCGELTVSGAKNAALPIIAASLLTPQPITLFNVPHTLKDISTLLTLMNLLGTDFNIEPSGTLTLSTPFIRDNTAPYDLVKTMRASILVLGPLLTRCGEAKISLPGGCAIGARPVDLHIKGMEALGAHITLENGYIHAYAPHALKGTSIVFETVTVTGTENLLMAAVLAEGTTVLKNAAREPEVTHLAYFLASMGAHIEGIGTETLVIEGIKSLKRSTFSILPDRIQAGTYLVAAACTGGNICLHNIDPSLLDCVLLKLQEAGATLETGKDWVSLSMRGKRPQAVHIKTAPYPAFPTDMQAQFMTLNCLAQGTGMITETIFENRFMHALELQRMGADLILEGNTVISKGVEKLWGAEVMATDLRASASLVLAGLAAEGETVIDRIYHIDRGYAHLEENLKKLGAFIYRTTA